jgi:hypothetical protein
MCGRCLYESEILENPKSNPKNTLRAGLVLCEATCRLSDVREILLHIGPMEADASCYLMVVDVSIEEEGGGKAIGSLCSAVSWALCMSSCGATERCI